jgi:hypothetical protein
MAMKKTITPLYILLLSCLLAACNIEPEVTDIDLDDTNPKLVVEGLITDQAGPYFVKLSLTTSYYTTGATPKINDAAITIADDTGNREVLSRVEGQEGIYQTNSLRGQVGRTYFLTVTYKGQEYTASAYLPSGITIDSLVYSYQPKQTFFEEGYYVSIYAKEPFSDRNYYRWYLYKNDSLYNSSNDIDLETDEFYTTTIDSLPIIQKFDLSDKVRINIHSLTKEAYEYYQGLSNVLNTDGGLFGSPPKNPQSNISNGALGIFRASKVSSKEIVIE